MLKNKFSKISSIIKDAKNGKMFIVIGNHPVMNVYIIKKVSENKLVCDQSFETTIDHLANNNKKNILNF